MAKYFVHEGLEFQTIEVRPVTIGFSGNTNLQAITAESVIAALADGTTTGIIPGADAAAQLLAYNAVWNTEQAPGTIRQLNQDIFRRKVRLIADTTPGTGSDATVTANINSLSAQYILPPGFSDVLHELPDYVVREQFGQIPGESVSAFNTRLATVRGTRRNYALIKSLEIRHDNIIKHDTANVAWEAWRRYVEVTEASEDKSGAESGYLVKP